MVKKKSDCDEFFHVFQSGGKLHGDDDERRSSRVLPAEIRWRFSPVQTVRAGMPPDHKSENLSSPVHLPFWILFLVSFFLVIAKALGVWSASYTLWRESVKTVTCLNLSVATETPRLFPQRGLLLRASSKETAATCLPFLQTLAGQDSATHAACLLLSDNQMLSLQNKRGSQKSAAVQFVKQDWGRLQTHSY